ncbi:glycosyltransferase family 4 protein [Shimia sp. CNT1-13L.2]|uniref:glycosyltransferase family 4 protein n=1 Tax=Shimia sp. CNT1-13L.2 TaxID=2959663 RepID=UPI0020CF1FE5|nr:glycosyltransferase family 4 protein [Shimia sp. CNT1-13L.2]MCP9482822.1 glycosyltransferase family 4 protein [Shimia sp. CNT1-13L.2]
MSPHILFVANEVLGWRTYADQFEAAALDRTDVKVTVYRRRPSKMLMRLARRHADTAVSRWFRPFDPITLHGGRLGKDIRQQVMQHRPDLVHFAAHWPAGALPRGEGAPPFTLALDATRASISRDLPLAGWRAGEIETEANVCRRASRVFPMSGWVARSLEADYGVSSDHIMVAPPSLGRSRWPKPAACDGTPAQILFVGNDLARKGARRLAAWVEGPLAGRCHLTIVSGDTATPPDGPNITFLGRVDHQKIIEEILPKMDVFCLPTRLDMSPFVVVEAAAAGLPVVASRIGGMEDLVLDGQTGFLPDAGDDQGFLEALTTLIGDGARRRQMGRAAAEHAERHFDGTRNFHALLDQLAEIATTEGRA